MITFIIEWLGLLSDSCSTGTFQPHELRVSPPELDDLLEEVSFFTEFNWVQLNAFIHSYNFTHTRLWTRGSSYESWCTEVEKFGPQVTVVAYVLRMRPNEDRNGFVGLVIQASLLHASSPCLRRGPPETGHRGVTWWIRTPSHTSASTMKVT